MTVKDQMQRTVALKSAPKRIVSLVPSQTELLHHLGLQEKVVGITKFCIYPDRWFREKHRIGGTKKVNFDKIAALTPDLIIGNKEENDRADIAHLEQSYPVWMSDIFNLEDALAMIAQIGVFTDTEEKATQLIKDIELEFEKLDSWAKDFFKEQPSVAYLIWDNPSYSAGTNTFIHAMIERCGLKNFMQEERYPELKMETNSPDYIFLSSEPFPFKKKHIERYEQSFPKSKVILVDGELFSWYGSRLLHAPRYFRELLEQLTSD